MHDLQYGNYNYDEVEGWWSVGDMYDDIHLHHPSFVVTVQPYDEGGWWMMEHHPTFVRCIHLSTVNYNYDEGRDAEMDT